MGALRTAAAWGEVDLFRAWSDSTALPRLAINTNCIDDPFGMERSLIVDSDSLYNSWSAGIKDYQQCRDYQLPEIDFARYRLVGLQLFADCNASFGLRLWPNKSERIQHLLVTEDYGGCRGMRMHERWVLVRRDSSAYALQLSGVAASGDFNGDDRSDVVFWSSDRVVRVIYNWDGNDPVPLPLPKGATGEYMFVDDRNADGYQDLVLEWGGGGEAVLFGSEKGLMPDN